MTTPRTAEATSTPMPGTMERRRDQRHMSVLRIGKISLYGREQLCLIRNISNGGLMAHVYCEMAAGDPVQIEIKNGHTITGKVVWFDAMRAGIAFDDAIDVLHFLANEQEELMKDQVPRSPRIPVQVRALVRRGSDHGYAEVVDLSQGGAKVAPANVLMPDDDVVLMIPGLPATAASVRWQRDEHAGLAFHQLMPFETLATWVAEHNSRPHSLS